ncbi:hypothetical protein C1645_830339 [Glomus cerebriforme]|uniref:Uncharacterized protein n=1 Tax=Glomus cerebriforme TaxID=658196 RepID=A0A397SP74_9GLOM|nr:hypothetical protein C1645_830339 [Glomus cerebriforme]
MEANSSSSLCQLHSEIELCLKDEVKYSRLQEFHNMNLTAEMPLVYNTIFKSVDEICKNNAGFVEDDYEEPQILLNMALEDCSDGIIKKIWELTKYIQSTKNQSQFVVLLNDENEKQKTGTFFMINTIHGQNVYSDSVRYLDSKKEQYSRRALNGRPSNKRYLSALENNSSNKSNDVQEEISDIKKKRNKRQYSICKSWYYDS